MSELHSIPTTGRASLCSPDHSRLEDVQWGQHYQCQITSCSQSDCCAKFKLRGQPEKHKVPLPQLVLVSVWAVWYTSEDTCPTLVCTGSSHIYTSSPRSVREQDKGVQAATSKSSNNVYVQKALLNLHRQPWHILISWGSFCYSHYLMLKRNLCVSDADLYMCHRLLHTSIVQ